MAGLSADPPAHPCAGDRSCAPGARAAADSARQPNHHPERLVHRLGVAKHPRHIRIKRDGSVARGRSQALAERRVARGVSGAADARHAGRDQLDLNSRGFALAAPNLRSIAARARGPLRVPAGASRSLPRFLSSNRFINDLSRFLLVAQFTPQDLADVRLRQVRTELDVLRLLVAG